MNTTTTMTPLSGAQITPCQPHAAWLTAVQIGLTVRGMLQRQPHQLREERAQSYSQEFILDAALAGSWNSLFATNDGGQQAASICSVGASFGVTAYYRIFLALGINLSNLLHESWEYQLSQRYQADAQYRVDTRLEGVASLPRKRARVTIVNEVYDAAGQCVARHRDHFQIRRAQGSVPPPEQANPPAEPAQPSRLVHQELVAIPQRSGLRYARVSRDYNFVHILPGVHRLFGFRRPFVQGLFTAQLAMARIAARLGRAPRQFTARFCRPVLEGSRSELSLHEDGRFQLHDEGGRLLAEGLWE